MNINPRDHHQKDIFQAKKEGDHEHDHNDPNYPKFSKIISTTTSRQWSTFKNPRIVRVSRTFGGKDRHSKVCTVKGLRDRRIRLSVPTAIQLYDLQDRLGLSQPSKVVDWLLEATKHDIDKLPPLPIIPGLNFPNHEPNIQENQGFEGFMSSNHQVSAQNLFPLSSSSQSSSLVPNFPYNLQWDPPNLSLSQFGPGGGYYNMNTFSNDQEESHSNLSLNPQLYLPSIIAPFSSQMINTSIENNIDHLRQMNPFQNLQQNSILPTTLQFISSPMKSFALNVNSKSVNSQEDETGKRHKNN